MYVMILLLIIILLLKQQLIFAITISTIGTATNLAEYNLFNDLYFIGLDQKNKTNHKKTTKKTKTITRNTTYQ